MTEQRILAEHAARPGFTSRGFERSGSYDRLAAAVPPGRVLDLACGDGALLRRLPDAIGLDLSPHELALAGGDRVRARAQALPFADASFDAITCHLAFMLFDPLDSVVAELARVLRPGGSFLAILGGGPVASPELDDVFAAAQFGSGVSGDRRARTEEGWRELFSGWTVPPFERYELVLDGTADEVGSFLEASYSHPAAELQAELARRSPPIRCRAVTWLARATYFSAQTPSSFPAVSRK